MREIKFRAWDKRQHKMFYPIDIFNEHGVGWEDTPEGNLTLCRIMDGYGMRDVFELMQFTGLHDKNGKEIYEGDIIQEYFEAACVSKFQKPYEIKWDINCFNVPRMSWLCEVIGNIYGGPMKLKRQREDVADLKLMGDNHVQEIARRYLNLIRMAEDAGMLSGWRRNYPNKKEHRVLKDSEV